MQWNIYFAISGPCDAANAGASSSRKEVIFTADSLLQRLLDGIRTLPNGVRVVATVPHPVNFYWEGSEGNLYVAEGSGALVNARPVEEVVSKAGCVELISTRFVGDPETEAVLLEFKSRESDVLVIGSIIAAQAYPGLVVGLVPAPGFERVAVAEKRMSPCRFNTYG